MSRLLVSLVCAALAVIHVACGADGAGGASVGRQFVGEWLQDKSPEAVAHFLAEASRAWADEDHSSEEATDSLAEEVRAELLKMGFQELPEELDRRLELLRRQYVKVSDRIRVESGGSISVVRSSGDNEQYRGRVVDGVLQIYAPGESEPMGTLTPRGPRLELRILDGPSNLWTRARP